MYEASYTVYIFLKTVSSVYIPFLCYKRIFTIPCVCVCVCVHLATMEEKTTLQHCWCDTRRAPSFTLRVLVCPHFFHECILVAEHVDLYKVNYTSQYDFAVLSKKLPQFLFVYESLSQHH